ncbi:MAG TPA: cupin domain-containing protein [Chthoniobacterales bacterium]|nr:cupin domain-containing protein [Chthoniobacterales bacterium]
MRGKKKRNPPFICCLLSAICYLGLAVTAKRVGIEKTKLLLQTMEIIQRDSVPVFAAPDKSIIRELAASRNSSAKKQSLAEATIAVGESVTEHFHRVTEEFYHILSGTGLMKINDEEEQVNPGDTVIILPGMRHKITNNGPVPLVLLACCSPEWTAEDQVLVE